MSEDLLILLARVLGIAGGMVLAMSAVLGVLLASRTGQWLRLLKGRTFRVHRLLSMLGAGLLLAHPVPVVLARETTGVGPAAVVVPFAAEKHGRGCLCRTRATLGTAGRTRRGQCQTCSSSTRRIEGVLATGRSPLLSDRGPYAILRRRTAAKGGSV